MVFCHACRGGLSWVVSIGFFHLLLRRSISLQRRPETATLQNYNHKHQQPNHHKHKQPHTTTHIRKQPNTNTTTRVCIVKSVDASLVTSFTVHECEGSSRVGSRPRRYLFTGHSNGCVQVRGGLCGWRLVGGLGR